MTTHELTSVYADPPVKTVGPLIEWTIFWPYFSNEIDNPEPFEQLSIADWLLEHLAFANDGVRMIER